MAIDAISLDIANLLPIWYTLAGYEETARDLSQSETQKYLNE